MGDSLRTVADASAPGGKKHGDEETPGHAYHMFGDRMAGSMVGISSELPPRNRTVFMLSGAEEPTGGSQSVRSSVEAGNDRGAKGRRKVEA
jgi:hypothetical protein